ncbi:GIY-YIG nuclease family protein [Neisseriaceae bacterium CLB008]
MVAADLGVAASGDWSVYLLWCAGDRLYTGISNQPDKRFLAHSQGKGAKFTRMHPPQAMKIVACCCSKGLALSLERRLKQHTAAQKRALWAQLPLAASLAVAEEASP